MTFAKARCCCCLLLQHGHLTATVSQQLKEQCSRSPQLWKELQQELTQELKAAKKDAKDARKGASSGNCRNVVAA
jgi:plasmid maintenance system antidote protein VapI